jgi:hypothetical protein
MKSKQNNSKIIDIEPIGPVLFEKSKKARHLNITVKPVQGVRVAVPRGVSLQKAFVMVQNKITWIQKHQKRLKTVEQQQNQWMQDQSIHSKAQIKRILGSRLQELAKIHGFKYNRVFFRNQKTRWGSCSSQNNINLNLRLIHLPQELIDYVILHELLHTRIKNHSRQFWNELEQLITGACALNKRLKQFKLGFFK